MSPLELLNNDCEQAVAERAPKTAAQLMKYAEEEWAKISLNKIRKKMQRMPKVYKWIAEHGGELYPEYD